MKITTLVKSLCLCAALTSNCALAEGKTPHTWHTVSTASGTWEAKLQMLNQGGSFVTREGALINDFAISPSHSQDYGFIFDDGDDFDVAYSLTMVEKSSNALLFKSKACVYVITASGPAKPDIRVSSFNGAKCDYKVIHGVGEDFMVG